MWNAVKNEVPRRHLRQEAFNTLEKAVCECIEFDVRSNEVYAALDFLQKSCPNKWGFTLFREGLEQFDWNIRAQYLREGLSYIKKHTGYTSASGS
ncbi:MAG TPA: hypothetical protein DCP14_03865 [Rhodobiaceae bacterium]|nr:hypothetical protein [Rhodobiaceae bacterium]|tara:strand:+ start:626 stop:910 length:285 start_codon:yes stop_codon:yes gene_type:complete